jgi:hypothetical protein
MTAISGEIVDITDKKSAEAWYAGMVSLRNLTPYKLRLKISELKTRLMFTDIMHNHERNSLKKAIGYLISERDKK